MENTKNLAMSEKSIKHMDKAFELLDEYKHYYILPPCEKTQSVLRYMDDIMRNIRKEFNIMITSVIYDILQLSCNV